jgi:hypothetical protein
VPARKKKRTGALLIAPTASSAASLGVSSAEMEGVQSSSAPSKEMQATGGGDSGSRGATARSALGAASGAEQPEASAANPMPDIFDGPYSSSEEGVEVILQRDPTSPMIAASTSPPPADDEQLETALFEQLSRFYHR